MSLRKGIMTTLWRVQQAQMIISIVFWSLTLTGIFYPYIRARFLNDLIGPDYVFLGMLLIFLVVIVSVLVFGLVFDRLKFWKEQAVVLQERNPYSHGGMVWPTHIILWEGLLSDDPEKKKTARDLLLHNLDDSKIFDAYSGIIRDLEVTNRDLQH